MIILLTIFVFLLLIFIINEKYMKLVDNKIKKLKWPFLNVIDENDYLVDIVCIRGPLEKEEDIKFFKECKEKNKFIIGCSSYLSFPNKCLNPITNYNHFFLKEKRIDELVNMWLHPFKNDKIIKNKNKLLLSESDFVDNITYLNDFDISSKKINYDFICYCPSDDNSCHVGWHYYNKNWPLAKKTIEIACNELKLKGILVGRKKCPLNVDKKNIERFEHLEYFDFMKKISESKFMIISSYEDASPRVITEALLVNTPVLVNDNIIGGWKYINEETGLFYNSLNIKTKIKEITTKNFNPRKYFLENYGKNLSGKKLRDFVVNIDSSFSKHKLLRFSVS